MLASGYTELVRYNPVGTVTWEQIAQPQERCSIPGTDSLQSDSTKLTAHPIGAADSFPRGKKAGE
jgi:hypothetical protein